MFWMEIAALFGMATKYAEGFLAIRYRTVDKDGHYLGGPFYYIENGMGSRWKWLAKLFAVFGMLAGLLGIGTITQINGITSAANNFFDPDKSHIAFTLFEQNYTWTTVIMGLIITICAALVIIGGLKRISQISQVVVPFMAIFYVLAGLIVIIGNISNVPEGLREIFTMAFSMKSVSGGVLGTVVASMTNAMRFGVARGCFSNEAGMGSAAITAAAATTDNPVRQGYINMTGTFWDTIVVCTITGLVIASSGVIGKTSTTTEGSYAITSEAEDTLALTHEEKSKLVTTEYTVTYQDGTLTLSGGAEDIVLTPYADASDSEAFAKLQHQPDSLEAVYENGAITGAWTSGCNAYIFDEDGTYYYEEAYTGSALTIKAFETVLGKAGAWLVTIGIALFAFSTILGWEYHGEKAFEYLFHSHKYNMIYRIIFSLVVYIGATTSLDLAWNFSDIANALMAIPNLICLLLLSKEIATDMREFQKVLAEEKAAKKRA